MLYGDHNCNCKILIAISHVNYVYLHTDSSPSWCWRVHVLRDTAAPQLALYEGHGYSNTDNISTDD